MKARDRVRVIDELEAQDGFSFIGMTGTVTKSFEDGVIITIDKEFFTGTALNDLFFEYAELEKI
ncbi:hypothetical protein phiK7A1_110 [Pseudomonas phage phiK7A1]|uniref:Uncharacterized protein n=1 Tax=Pseudomonas phage phiK7A1 TaxID=2759194 RepID=A0A7H0XFV8_9CAUD|nr:hypothetical protein phiK7A1_110 [Pseudomonas phage phiK7A1]